MRVFLKSILLILFCIIIYILFQAYSIYQSTHLAEKLMNSTTPYEQHPSNTEMRILVAGDSTAVGVGTTDNIYSTAGRLGAQFPKADLTNIGMNGAKLKDLLLALQKQKGQYYNLIVLQIGANDITHLTSYNVIREELSDVLSIASTLSPKILLLTSGDLGRAPIFQGPLSSLMTERTLKVRRIFIEEALDHPHVFYVDLYLDQEHDPFPQNLKKYYAPDSFHLTNEGYGVWYFFIQKQL